MQKVTREKPLHMLRQTWSKFEDSNSSRFKQHLKWVHPKDRIPEWKIKVDDIVKIISGKAKGQVGKVIKVDKWANRVFVDNVNFSKKTPRTEYETEDFDPSSIEKTGSWWMRKTLRAIHVSNVSLIHPEHIKPFEEGSIPEKDVQAVRVELIKKKKKNKIVSFRYIPKLNMYYDPIKKEKKEVEKKGTAKWDTRIEEVERRTLEVNLLPPFPPKLAAVYEGLSRIRNDEIGVTIAYGLHWSCYGILHALITITLFYYGSTLIKMTQKSFILSGVIPDGSRENNVQLRFFGASNENSDPSEITMKHLKLIKNLRKMRIFSYTLTGCFFMCTISLFAMAVMGYKLFEITLLSQLYYALCSIGVPLACIGINFGIIQAEIHPSGLIDTIADLSSYYHSQSESNSSENPL
nr:12100_t:CDS:2 [Entrophospora candida]